MLKDIGPIQTIEIDGIVETTPRIVKIISKETGKPINLPREFIEFLPGRVIMPAWLYNNIHRKTVEGRTNHQR